MKKGKAPPADFSDAVAAIDDGQPLEAKSSRLPSRVRDLGNCNGGTQSCSSKAAQSLRQSFTVSSRLLASG